MNDHFYTKGKKNCFNVDHFFHKSKIFFNKKIFMEIIMIKFNIFVIKKNFFESKIENGF